MIQEELRQIDGFKILRRKKLNELNYSSNVEEKKCKSKAWLSQANTRLLFQMICIFIVSIFNHYQFGSVLREIHTL